MTEREQNLLAWLYDQTGKQHDLVPASSDASFRRYFRVELDDGSRIVMDAPPPQEDCRPFVHVSELLANAGLNAPRVLAKDLEDGFLLLDDLGTRTYLETLNDETVEHLYGDALGALITLQSCIDIQDAELPAYDAQLLGNELALFHDWYLVKHAGISLTEQQEKVWQQARNILIESALAQPVVCVHRDYHSRNLMHTEKHNPGILDFQDAVIGPVTYDLASLLRDCYISWPREQVEDWVRGFYEQTVAAGIINNDAVSEAQFLEWFDLMGVQRHLKAIGIFARLLHRDGKDGYIADIPRTLAYVLEVSARYPSLRAFYELLQSLELPGMVQNTDR